MKKQILFSNRNWKHELRLEVERQNELREAEIAQESSRATAAEGELRASINAERSRATAAEKELLKRIQGKSEDSDSRNDPFKLLGYDSYANKDEGYATDEAFNAALNALLYDSSVVGGNQGFFRARVRWCEVEIQNIVLSNASDSMNIVQIVKGAITTDVTAKKITKDTGGAYKILYRQYKHAVWGEWKEYADLSDYPQKGELATVATSGSYGDLTEKPAFKTINGHSIIKGEGDTSDNIEITGGDGNIDLSGYVTDAEFAPVKEKVDGMEEGANRYIHPHEGATGSYAAYNPDTLVGAEKLIVPTITVNDKGHVTSAGINEIGLPDFTKYATSVTKDDLIAGVVGGKVDITDFFSGTYSKTDGKKLRDDVDALSKDIEDIQNKIDDIESPLWVEVQ